MLNKSATIVYAHNAFDTSKREITTVRPGTQLLAYVPKHDSPIVCSINGDPVLRENWDCELEADDIVVFHHIPAGGGGGSNPLQLVLSIALVVAGVVIANPALIYAGIGLGITALIPTPKFPIGAQSIDAPSPTYDVALAGNSARLGQVIPIIYGRHILFPDFAAQPYTEYVDNDSYYHALFCLGNSSDIVIESVSIDDTPITSFEDVQIQYQGASFSTLQTLVDVAVVNAPEVANQTLETDRWVGPFVTVGPGITLDELGIDVIMPKGLYYASDSGTLTEKSISWVIEALLINDDDVPLGEWTNIGTHTYAASTNTPQRRTYKYTLAQGRYQVRMKRADVKDENSRAGHDIEWAGMKAYVVVTSPLDNTACYMALKIRASSQLSGTSQRKISVVVRRKLPTWSPTGGWTEPLESQSIAWALADVLRNNVYGGNLSPDRIDLQTLYELDQIWQFRDDNFNAIFDKKSTIWQTLSVIARAGRARPLLRGSIFTFIRDSRQSLPVAMFNMRNIVKNSFSINYSMVTEDSPDGIEVEYFDERTWSKKYVQVPFPGIVEPANVTKTSYLGVTNKAQALREAAYQAADTTYRRIALKFTTEMEGFLPTFGDLIAVSQDIPKWGTSAEVVDVVGSTLTLSEEAAWGSGTHYAMLSDIYGDVHGPYQVIQGATADIAILLTDSTSGFYTGTEKERTRITIGEGTAFVKYCRVTSINPNEDGTIEMGCVVEDNRVHDYDDSFSIRFVTARPAYVMASTTPNYRDSTIGQQSGIGCYVARDDGTVGELGDLGYYYQ